MTINKKLFNAINNVPSRAGGTGTFRNQLTGSTPYGEQDTGPGQWEQPSEMVNEGPCYNILGQTIPCDDMNCIAGDCGSSLSGGTGDFYTGGGDPDPDFLGIDEETGEDPWGDNCYNITGQAVPCGDCPPGSLINAGQCIETGGGAEEEEEPDTTCYNCSCYGWSSPAFGGSDGNCYDIMGAYVGPCCS